MKEKLIDKEEIRNLHPVFKGRSGDRLINMLFGFSSHYCLDTAHVVSLYIVQKMRFVGFYG
jgi:hypothetical protein